MNLVDMLQMSQDQARTHLEKVRWPNGPVCPRGERRHEKHDVYKVNGTSARAGLYDCRTCRYCRFKGSQFTVTVNTIFEGGHIPLNKKKKADKPISLSPLKLDEALRMAMQYKPKKAKKRKK